LLTAEDITITVVSETSTLCHVRARYELYGVVAHGGQLTSSGHYIAYIRAHQSSDVNASVKLG